MTFTQKLLYFGRQDSNGNIFSPDCITNVDGTKYPVVYSNELYRTPTSNDVLGHAEIMRVENGVDTTVAFNESVVGKLAKQLMTETDEYGFGFTANKVVRNGHVIESMNVMSVNMLPKFLMVDWLDDKPADN